MKEIKLKFWCNAGHTEEEVTIEIYDGENEGNEIEINEIEKAFHKWLDNNEDCGWEKI